MRLLRRGRSSTSTSCRWPRSAPRRSNADVTRCDITRFWLSPRRPALLRDPPSATSSPARTSVLWGSRFRHAYRNAPLHSLNNCWTIGRMSALLALRNLKNSATLVPLSRSIVNRSALRPIPPTRGEDTPRAVVLGGLYY